MNKEIKLNHPCIFCKKVIYIELGGIVGGEPLHYSCFEQRVIEEVLKRVEGALLFPFEGELQAGRELERPKIMSMQRTAFNKLGVELLEDSEGKA